MLPVFANRVPPGFSGALLRWSASMRMGFVGSNLVDKLMLEGHEVTVLDNMFTGRKRNIQHWMGHPHFQLIVGDVVESLLLEVDQASNE